MLIDIRILPELAEVLSDLPRDNFTFLQTRHGSSRSPKAFGRLMRKWCDAAGLPECSSHGLRKAIARRLGDAGVTPQLIASVTGHKSIEEVAHYSVDDDRATSADAGFDRLVRTRPAQKVVNLPRKPSEPEGKSRDFNGLRKGGGQDGIRMFRNYLYNSIMNWNSYSLYYERSDNVTEFGRLPARPYLTGIRLHRKAET